MCVPQSLKKHRILFWLSVFHLAPSVSVSVSIASKRAAQCRQAAAAAAAESSKAVHFRKRRWHSRLDKNKENLLLR